MLDKVVTSTEMTYTDRLGGEHYTVDGIKAEGDKVVEETRQNLIPLSRQYMTLEAAQADIANIPEGSTTYYRSPDDSALAVEVINNAGTLQPTGRKMPSQQSIDRYFQVLPDGTFALMADNGVVLAIDKNAVMRAVSLAVQDLISIGGASFKIYQNVDGLYVFGNNGIPLALGPDGILRMAAANICGTMFDAESMGVPLLFRAENGILGAADRDGNFRFPGVITDRLFVGGKEITTGGSGNGNGDSAFSRGDRYVNSNGDLVPLIPDTKKMSAWGSSSLVVSGGSNNFATMASQLGVTDWNNQGQPGESSFQSAARFGGVPYTLIFPNNTIPASGSVAVTCVQTPSNFRNSSLKSFTGTVAGVPGTLSWSSSSLRFTRTGTGNEVSLSGGADFVPTIPASYRDGVVLLWMYKNDIKWDAVANPEVNEDAIFNNVLKTVTHLTTLGKRALVIGIFNDSSYSNSIFKTRLESLNNRMRDYFGDLYCDTQDYICSSQIWVDAGITPTASDLEMQAQGYKATSLSADTGHLSSVANNAVVQNVIKPKLVSLGWYK
ncbi:hypothetical protein [Klebsiella pneumoniae]|uniref:hypothetical protein n=1 Tax=Klebsiella pneumoniae TaxID=573 RepID=UPI001F4FD6A9|nr:hypothetical protein [Klebsiella pneumoniae]